ncbi:unnamed protein product [Spirodela intermedia]|uniref:Uncharacterized protein n=1 Tax=Spirodela intermedia TaxID=51605 RepID=A0A7I8L4N6_SPIIN|nr:unnamed protein product [Spirodela intermedia]
MHVRSNMGDGFRVSTSSVPSNSSQGSGPDDCESLGDVYVWGKVWFDGVDGCSKTDVLLPKLLESNIVLEVQHIACGARHAALVTRQGEVFTWGEDNGGRLGRGYHTDFSHPQLIESLAIYNIDYVVCGEHHSCAISVSGDLYTWGNDNLHVGFLGHGTDVSHWIPKRVSSPLEGFQVLYVACGSWHSALVTFSGRLYTFGDGTFGVLGHGDRESIAYPREVESLNGLKTIKVACGVWHTAAIVEISGQFGVNVISRKLFTWGDGDKYRLGHGDRESRLVPTCVSSLIDYNFHQLACGHTLTVSLTTSGHVFTMGSTCYGQLGNPHSNGIIPCIVQDRLVGELVEEIACGAYHVAVVTSRSEVFTWGKGANGRLGHGDIEDRTTPTLVEALKDKHIKSISCGSNFMASICIHKWVSSIDQSFCSGCRQAFSFTRKSHNCYNCGLVHCHACSSKKVMRAALAPTLRKPHRVCDSCYTKLKALETKNVSSDAKKSLTHRRSLDYREKSEKKEMKLSKVLLAPIVDPLRYYESKMVKQGIKEDFSSLSHTSQIPSLLQLKDISFFGSISALQVALKPVVTSASPNSRPTSPFSTRPTSPQFITPIFSKSAIDNLKKTNELLNQEVLRLQAQVKGLRQRCEVQDVVIQRYEKKTQATSVDEEESSNLTLVELDKSMTTKKRVVATEGMLDATRDFRIITSQVEGSKIKTNNRISQPDFYQDHKTIGSNQVENERIVNLGDIVDSTPNHFSSMMVVGPLPASPVESSSRSRSRSVSPFSNHVYVTRLENFDAKEGTQNGSMETDPRSLDISMSKYNKGGKEVIEQFEPGVYITVILLQDGTKVFKRVRFSKRRFAEHQAEEWWKANQDQVFKKYIHPNTHIAPSTSALPMLGPDKDDVAPSSL